MMTKSQRLLSVSLVTVILLIMLTAFTAVGVSQHKAYAASMTVIQNTNEVFYSAESYINNFGELNNFSTVSGQFSNPVFDALDFRFDNSPVTVDPVDITINNYNEIKLPKVYSLDLSVRYNGLMYQVGNVPLTVKERAFEANPTVTQETELVYNGFSYILNTGTLNNFSTSVDGFSNALYSALVFSADGQTVNVDPDKIFFYDTNNVKITAMKKPGTYRFNILFGHEGKSYFVKNASVVLNKSVLNVYVQLNGELDLTVLEGEEYSPKIVYSGFLAGDNVGDALTYPAVIPNEPLRPINRYEIRAEGALSDYYEMNYVSSYITILPNPVEEMTFTAEGEDLLILRGNYSPYCELEFVSVGVSDASVIYTEMKNTMDKYFSTSGLFDEYKPIASYRINLRVKGEKEELAQSSISIKLDEKLKGHDEYKILALTNDGVYQVISANFEHGYLSFNTADLGDFVVLAPIRGINTTQFLIIAFVLFGVISLSILLFAVFRKKY